MTKEELLKKVEEKFGNNTFSLETEESGVYEVVSKPVLIDDTLNRLEKEGRVQWAIDMFGDVYAAVWDYINFVTSQTNVQDVNETPVTFH